MITSHMNFFNLDAGSSSRQEFSEKKIVILGLARQGTSLARFFVRAGAQVTISDLSTPEALAHEQSTLEDLPIRYVLGEHPSSLLEDCDLLCLSGGVPLDLPIADEALARGIPLSNDSLLTLQTAGQLGLGPTIAITGSSGKTTTTTLIGRMLETAGYRPHVGGNIGSPLLHRLSDIGPHEPIVLELSSFQLELFDPAIALGRIQGNGPETAALLNITPNHLDRHPSMAAYVAAKLNLIRAMPRGARLILNADDPVTARLIPDFVPASSSRECRNEASTLSTIQPVDLPAKWKVDDLLEETKTWIREQGLVVTPFSRLQRLERGAWLEGDRLVLDGDEICRRTQVRLPGEHNLSNLLAAAATVAAAAGAAKTGSPTIRTGTNGDTNREKENFIVNAVETVAETFAGVAHRLEIVAKTNEVTWVNDSIATSPERALAGLRAMQSLVESKDQTLILLAGGKDKNLPWDDLAAEIVERVDYLIGFGQSGPMLVELVQDRARYRQGKAPNCAVVQRLDEAVALAGRTAHKKTIVLLSPGGTSYDMYKDFEARGEHFRELAQLQVATGVRG